MPRKFLYLINPISGSSSKKKAVLKKLITDKTTRENIKFEIAETKADGEYSWLPDKLHNEHFTDVIICGGDGSVNKIVQILVNSKVNIGIIPGGSGNGLAYSVNIPSKIEDALEVIFHEKAHRADAFYINDIFSCMLCGIGMDAKIAHDFAKQPARGLSTYVKQSLKNFIDSDTFNFTIEINGLQINTDAFFISIANSNQFGNNFTIAPKASIHDGLLDIVIVPKMSKAKLIFAIGRQLKFGKITETPESKEKQTEILYFQTTSLKIRNHNNAPLHIDGDPANSALEFNIEILPRAFSLIHP